MGHFYGALCKVPCFASSIKFSFFINFRNRETRLQNMLFSNTLFQNRIKNLNQELQLPLVQERKSKPRGWNPVIWIIVIPMEYQILLSYFYANEQQEENPSIYFSKQSFYIKGRKKYVPLKHAFPMKSKFLKRVWHSTKVLPGPIPSIFESPKKSPFH